MLIETTHEEPAQGQYKSTPKKDLNSETDNKKCWMASE